MNGMKIIEAATWCLASWLVVVVPAGMATRQQEAAQAPTAQPAGEGQGLRGVLPSQPPKLVDDLPLLRPDSTEGGEAGKWRQVANRVAADLAKLYEGTAADAAAPLDIAAQRELLKQLRAAQQELSGGLKTAQGELAAQLQILHHRLNRRLGLLEASLEAVEGFTPPSEEELNGGRQQLEQDLTALDKHLSTWSSGEGWRRYVQFEELRKLAAAPPQAADADQVAVLAKRFDPAGVDARSRVALEKPAFVQVRNDLVRYGGDLRRRDPAAGEAFRERLRQLWVHLEAYESEAAATPAPPSPLKGEGEAVTEGSPSKGEGGAAPAPSEHARAIRQVSAELAAVGPAGQKVAEALAAGYLRRNAWIAVSRVFVQKFLPGTTVERGPVRMQRGETYVSGEQETRATPRIRFHEASPAAFSVELSGVVDTSIVASQERADVAASVVSRFLASRRIELTKDGLRAGRTNVDVRADSSVEGTDVRGTLLFGGIARRRAAEIGQRELSRSEPETEQRIAGEIRQRFDPEVDKFVSKVNDKFEELRKRWKEETTGAVDVVSSSTEHWLLVDATYADAQQLGAWSPRLATPRGTLAAFQVHESAVNNAIAKADLAGKTYDRRQLKDMLEDAIAAVTPEEKAEGAPAPAQEEESIKVTFSDQEPVHVTLQGGVVQLAVRATAFEGQGFKTGPRQVRVHYRPVLDEKNLRLVREGESAIEPLDPSMPDTEDPKALAELHRVLETVFEPESVQPRAFSVSLGEEPEGKAPGRQPAASRKTAPRKQPPRIRILSVEVRDGWLAAAVGD